MDHRGDGGAVGFKLTQYREMVVEVIKRTETQEGEKYLNREVERHRGMITISVETDGRWIYVIRRPGSDEVRHVSPNLTRLEEEMERILGGNPGGSWVVEGSEKDLGARKRILGVECLLFRYEAALAQHVSETLEWRPLTNEFGDSIGFLERMVYWVDGDERTLFSYYRLLSKETMSAPKPEGWPEVFDDGIATFDTREGRSRVAN